MRRLALALALLAGACAPRLEEAGPPVVTPRLDNPAATMADGFHLPMRSWIPAGEPRTVLLALHGFNDHGDFLSETGPWLATKGVAAYAYDQRGFGSTAIAGLWAGTDTLVGDLDAMVRLLRARHPGKPLYLLGESMGGAVVLAAMGRPDPPPVEGAILSAPAVWGRETMPWYQVLALELSGHTVPWMTVSGRGLNKKPSDNYPMLCALGRDPLVIKDTRVDAVHGLVGLMDAALDAAPRLKVPALVLYGLKDDIIPKEPTRRMLARLPTGPRRVAVYPEGYHMLLRDLSADIFWRDILAWIEDRRAPLPSSADETPWREMMKEDSKP